MGPLLIVSKPGSSEKKGLVLDPPGKITEHLARKTMIPPVAAERVVFIATCAARAPMLPLLMLSVEPGLNPYQPGSLTARSTDSSEVWMAAQLKIDVAKMMWTS